MAIENSIALAQAYLPLIDEVYKRESLTSRFDYTSDRVRFIGANVAQVYKATMDGLADYGRNTGFVQGSVNGAWETMTLGEDRGVSLTVDVLDNDETMGMAFGTLLSQLLRTQVVPELDAYRFAQMASFTGIGKAAATDITVGTTDVAEMLDTAEQVMGDAEVPLEGRICFMSETCYAAFKENIARYLGNDSRVSRDVTEYNGMPIVRVPKNRFNTAITLNDGSSEFGYTIPASTSYPINFMIVQPDSIVQIVKHAVPRIFSPQVNQMMDAWKLDYRIYHDIFQYENKQAGIYLSAGSTANS